MINLTFSVPELYGYSVVPIDMGWDMLPTKQAFRDRLVLEYTAFRQSDGSEPYISPEGFDALWEEAQRAAYDTVHSWEGNVRDEVHVFFVPDESEFGIGFVWKQENNGTTFIVSTVPLPHLEKLQ